MLDKAVIEEKMKERGFVVYAYIGSTVLQFVSSHMYDANYDETTLKRDRRPIINILVNLESEDFEGKYAVPFSTNILTTNKCGSVMNDKHFDRIICKLESQAKLLMFYSVH